MHHTLDLSITWFNCIFWQIKFQTMWSCFIWSRPLASWSSENATLKFLDATTRTKLIGSTQGKSTAWVNTGLRVKPCGNSSNADSWHRHTRTSEGRNTSKYSSSCGVTSPQAAELPIQQYKTTHLAEHITSTFGWSYKKKVYFFYPYEQGCYFFDHWK